MNPIYVDSSRLSCYRGHILEVVKSVVERCPVCDKKIIQTKEKEWLCETCVNVMGTEELGVEKVAKCYFAGEDKIRTISLSDVWGEQHTTCPVCCIYVDESHSGSPVIVTSTKAAL